MTFSITKFALFATVAVAASYASALTLHGSTTVKSTVFDLHQKAIEADSGLTLNIVGNGTSRGIKGLASGQADIGMISAELSAVLTKLKLAEDGTYVANKIGSSDVAFAVHSSNPVKTLTTEQIVGILKGEITNWSKVGGEAKPIVIVTEYAGGGIRTMVEKKLLNKESLTANARAMPNGTQIVKVAQQIPQAFAVAALASTKGSSLKLIETDANVSQPLILVTKGAPNAEAQKLIDASRKALGQ